jgi:hypothetical protein
MPSMRGSRNQRMEMPFLALNVLTNDIVLILVYGRAMAATTKNSRLRQHVSQGRADGISKRSW